MPELVIQTLVCTFRCNPPFQEALLHDMHGIIYSPCAPPPQKKKKTKQTLFCLPIILPFLFPLFFSITTVLFTHHPAVSLPTVFFHHHCFVYPASCHFSSHFFPSPLFCYPSSCRFSSHCFFLPIIVCFLNVG